MATPTLKAQVRLTSTRNHPVVSSTWRQTLIHRYAIGVEYLTQLVHQIVEHLDDERPGVEVATGDEGEGNAEPRAGEALHLHSNDL